MALVKIPKRELAKHLRLDEEVIEKISMMGIPVEKVTEEDIEIEVMPNRPDVLSVQGFIRAFKAFLGKETGLKKYKINKPEKNFIVKIDSSVENVRPFTACAIVKNLKFDDDKIKEIIDLQEKLHATIGRNRKKAAIGIYPLEKITLPIKFEARKPQDIKFVPLESSEEMNGLQILQKHPAGREFAFLLDGLEKFPIFADAKGKILSMPPIINSHDTGKITDKTRDIFIECSGFDFSTLKKVLNIIVSTLADMDGKVYAMELQYQKNDAPPLLKSRGLKGARFLDARESPRPEERGFQDSRHGRKIITPDFSAEKVKISLENSNKLLGLNLKEKDLEKFLPRMGYGYKKGSVIIPPWRVDIMHEVDIVEDIAIAYGYDKFVPEILQVATIAEESPLTKLPSRVSQALIGLGLLEISTYHLIKEEEYLRTKIDEQKIEVENSKTEYKLLRPNLTIPALRIISENKDNEYPQKIFEIGTVFSLDKSQASETGIKEKENLLIACSPANFTELKQILDYLTGMLEIEYELEENKKIGFIEGRTGSILINKKECGFIGETHPEMLKEWGIKMPLSIIELSLEEFVRKSQTT